MAQLLFFGRLGEMAGGDARTLPLAAPIPITGLIAQLTDAEPVLGSALVEERVRCAVNGVMVQRDHVIVDGDEIAFMPPVSGG